MLSALVRRFEREGWLLSRTYHNEIGATLTQSFGTEDRGAVEACCRASAIDWSWQPDGARPGPRRPPPTGSAGGDRGTPGWASSMRG
ncbi:hypothetical protein ACIQ8D_19760 [Streptomyces sp. NPDC096094]|uniref:hypothetical protein n=1 Tax=unclassified Streptomyces TaxID=2593676 RepID=UPI00380716E7